MQGESAEPMVLRSVAEGAVSNARSLIVVAVTESRIVGVMVSLTRGAPTCRRQPGDLGRRRSAHASTVPSEAWDRSRVHQRTGPAVADDLVAELHRRPSTSRGPVEPPPCRDRPPGTNLRRGRDGDAVPGPLVHQTRLPPAPLRATHRRGLARGRIQDLRGHRPAGSASRCVRPRPASTVREAIRQDVGVVFGALDRARFIGAAFVSFVGDEAVYETGGFLDSAEPLCPNHALQAESIAMSVERGCSS